VKDPEGQRGHHFAIENGEPVTSTTTTTRPGGRSNAHPQHSINRHRAIQIPKVCKGQKLILMKQCSRCPSPCDIPNPEGNRSEHYIKTTCIYSLGGASRDVNIAFLQIVVLAEGRPGLPNKLGGSFNLLYTRPFTCHDTLVSPSPVHVVLSVISQGCTNPIALQNVVPSAASISHTHNFFYQ
jgi:hypothetical protein